MSGYGIISKQGKAGWREVRGANKAKVDRQKTLYVNRHKLIPSVFNNWKGKRVDNRWCYMIKESIKKLHWWKSGLMVEGMGWKAQW